MSDIAIRAENLSKSYRISHEGGPHYRTLRESLVDLAARQFRRASTDSRETIWALKDVNLEVHQGEVLGIIGRNGAGKSTLLKVLSRITPPTSGRAEVSGRLGSLLEVGTGFHPELTGRENIYLNGAILGMRRREIQRRFDEIVAFAETEQFLDTPVKRYSSGMYLRLAFAVAAHLDTDLLMVDEVLAVGDANFQAKSVEKMRDVSQSGRTVLFVSHNLSSITLLCPSAILLDRGRIEASGPSSEVVGHYLAAGMHAAQVDLATGRSRDPSAPVWLAFAEMLDSEGHACQDFPMGSDLTIRFRVKYEEPSTQTRLALSIRTADGLPMTLTADVDAGFVAPTGLAEQQFSVRLRDIRFYPGEYRITLWVSDGANVRVYDHAEDCLTFRIPDGGRITSRPLPRHWGVVFVSPQWSAD